MSKFITLIFSVAILLLISGNAHSQNFNVNAYSFYTLDDDIDASNGNNYFTGTIKGNLLWGIGLEYEPVKDYGIELLYYREDTDFPVSYYDGLKRDQTFKLGMNFILLGANRYLRVKNSKIEPYAGAMLGMAILENKNPLPGAETSLTKFAWALKAGVNIMASPQVGIKFQMQLLSAVQSVGGGLVFGTGGAGVGLGTNSSMLQLSFGGGLVFRFGKDSPVR
jgi:hypothetical protein